MKLKFIDGPLQGAVQEREEATRTIDIVGEKGRYVRKFMDRKFGVAVYKWSQIGGKK